MTRQYFINEVNSFDELVDFCNDYNCSECDDVYSEAARDEYINDSLTDMARYADSWYELFNRLDSIPTGYDWYSRDDYDEWSYLDEDDFYEYKQRVLERADEEDVWEEEEDEEEAPLEDEMIDDDFVAGDEPISIGELMGVCSSRLQQIGDDNKKMEEAQDEAFGIFVSGCLVVEVE